MSEEHNQNLLEKFNISEERVQELGDRINQFIIDYENQELTVSEFILSVGIVAGGWIANNENGTISDKIMAAVQGIEIFESGMRAGIAAQAITRSRIDEASSDD